MHLLRVVIADRPGSLGALATALGKVDADIAGIDVIEHRGDGSVVDDILVDLPHGRMTDTLVSAVNSVEGAHVEFVRFYPHRGGLLRDLQAVEAMTEEPARADAILVAMAADVFRADWCLILERAEDGEVLLKHRSNAAPEELSDVTVSWLPITRARRLPDPEAWAPTWGETSLAGATIGGPEQVIVVGRRGGPDFLDSELARLGHLVTLARAIRTGSA
ncbi:MAG: ACT domain-containing protein [Sporichthyaceae bacterium]